VQEDGAVDHKVDYEC